MNKYARATALLCAVAVGALLACRMASAGGPLTTDEQAGMTRDEVQDVGSSAPVVARAAYDRLLSDYQSLREGAGRSDEAFRRQLDAKDNVIADLQAALAEAMPYRTVGLSLQDAASLAATIGQLNTEVARLGEARAQAEHDLIGASAARDAAVAAARNIPAYTAQMQALYPGRELWAAPIACTGSEYPHFRCADLVYNMVIGPGEAKTGHVIVFPAPLNGQGCELGDVRNGPWFIMHQIIAGDAVQGWRTQGENNLLPDRCVVPDVKILGLVIGSVANVFPDRHEVLGQAGQRQ